MKAVNKIILIIQIVTIILMISPLMVKAGSAAMDIVNGAMSTTTDESGDAASEGAIDGAASFIEDGSEVKSPLSTDNLKETSDILYNMLLIIGIIIAVIVGLFLAMKIMMGSIGEKAEYKQMLIPYVAGCIVIFGAFTIWKIIVDLLNQTQ